MTPTIRIRCPNCHAHIKVPTQLLGQTRSCPGCKERLVIQVSAPEDSEPMLFDGDLSLPQQSTTGAKAEGKLILLVDDDRELNDALRSLLEKRGHRVIQAFDGVQAKEMVHQQQPHLMILDMMMPRMGGYPVLEHFQDKPDAPPVIMITAKEGSQHKVYAEYLGVIDYLPKPFAIERFLESVEKGLGGMPDGSTALAGG